MRMATVGRRWRFAPPHEILARLAHSAAVLYTPCSKIPHSLAVPRLSRAFQVAPHLRALCGALARNLRWPDNEKIRTREAIFLL